MSMFAFVEMTVYVVKSAFYSTRFGQSLGTSKLTGKEEGKNWNERKIERKTNKVDQPYPYHCYCFGDILEFNLELCTFGQYVNTFLNTAKLHKLINDKKNKYSDRANCVDRQAERQTDKQHTEENIHENSETCVHIITL